MQVSWCRPSLGAAFLATPLLPTDTESNFYCLYSVVINNIIIMYRTHVNKSYFTMSCTYSSSHKNGNFHSIENAIKFRLWPLSSNRDMHISPRQAWVENHGPLSANGVFCNCSLSGHSYLEDWHLSLWGVKESKLRMSTFLQQTPRPFYYVHGHFQPTARLPAGIMKTSKYLSKKQVKFSNFLLGEDQKEFGHFYPLTAPWDPNLAHWNTMQYTNLKEHS